ncbi:MAG: hypothetical protein A3H59_02705 [Candidatus Jacksonbacteria bacterium RIFCSPLOWO2_02_FULL_43_9]|nr:MAG: hypothetical protein UV70_C0011G0031 [Parcubacteria group bacterium GW2011_GWA2_43_13]OGY69319.1 MAG: hypothetical protein A3B94_03030 [Candidatus Jacksonbacteria bacterium RIFCSPHIGHO2_02_FULL_43_10]OGY71224.1 MAG: hypothetical protein A2986_00150 [Candidatus Jacksonbacteria bacterium RIFCSPLOWO2_01_FULL_44_13]OGY71922.1 MAG: hypothetical protein A3H59_02705 [Candidatus Jacksonbacteria bacterium RIFCSPLOWO2_02_FULL_43_9]HAZ16797.1 ABC transporter [Candidatus Jacksonbacteria bacterium]
MKLHRIWAVILHYLYTQKRSIPRTMDIFYWPTLNILLWGFLSMFLQKTQQGSTSSIIAIILGALMLWMLFNRAQQDISIHFLEDVWNRNLLNLFVSPLTATEYIFSFIILSVFKVVIVGGVMTGLSLLLYHFNIFSIGIALVPFILNLLFFGWTIGLLIMTLIMRWGTDAQILAFSFAFLLQPFSAVFYPVAVLPKTLQLISYAFPSTYVFEGMRSVIATGEFSQGLMIQAFGANILYVGLAVIVFQHVFKKVLDQGLLTKLE